MERAEAKALGKTRYNTGRPCKHGHMSDRMTCSGTCCECLRLTVASNKYRTPEAIARRGQGINERAKANGKKQVRTAVRSAVRDGRLFRPDNCSECGVKCTPHGHHEDYSKPLVVEWLCKICHRARHPQ